jgi:hypothetical protein
MISILKGWLMPCGFRSCFLWSVLAPIVFCSACGRSGSSTASAAPTREDVEKVLKQSYDKEGGQFSAKETLTVNGAKFGKPYTATVQEVQVEGVPDGATVTPAVIDFTVRTFNTGETHLFRRVREGSVYVGKMGEWVVKTGSPVGEDVSTVEPVPK